MRGRIFEATAVAVTDVFGDVTFAEPPDGRWNLFRLDTERNPLDSLEPVRGRGPGRGHRRSAARGGASSSPTKSPTWRGAWSGWCRIHRTRRDASGPPAPQLAATPTGLVWTLTPPSPPGNWFPLLPTTIGRLALGALWSARTQRPAGQLLAELRASRQPLHQSEVPPEGAQVSRRWQSARAIDGTLHFWIGRSKTPRLTDTAPAVRFDVVEWN